MHIVLVSLTLALAFVATCHARQSTCSYDRGALSVSCSSPAGSVTCDTVQAHSSSSPIPTGQYIIGSKYRHGQHNIPWFNLYARKQSGSGYWDYYYNNPDTNRGYFGLHPGTLSLGCVTVSDSACWDTLMNIVDAGDRSQQRVSSSWGRSKTVSYVGYMAVY